MCSVVEKYERKKLYLLSVTTHPCSADLHYNADANACTTGKLHKLPYYQSQIRARGKQVKNELTKSLSQQQVCVT